MSLKWRGEKKRQQKVSPRNSFVARPDAGAALTSARPSGPSIADGAFGIQRVKPPRVDGARVRYGAAEANGVILLAARRKGPRRCDQEGILGAGRRVHPGRFTQPDGNSR